MQGAVLNEAERLNQLFQQAGAKTVHADVLQPAETLLDIYGEDIRARAYITADPLRGEMMLRPDFTVPIVQAHMAGGVDPARYCYAGKVFRKQETDETRNVEFVQAGYEVFASASPAEADAEVFALISQGLNGLPVRAATGDIGILKAAVRGLNTSDARKAALMRHIWRPARFTNLLHRFGADPVQSETRRAILSAADPFADVGPSAGLRRRAEVAARIERLRQDAKTPPISNEELALIDRILGLRDTAPKVLLDLRDIAQSLPAIAPAVDTLAARLDALEKRAIDVEALEFEGSFGRTSLEYYDGFVFGFYAEHHAEMPPVATGGRYDALTSVLGKGRAIPAVGGVIRPALAVQLREGHND